MTRIIYHEEENTMEMHGHAGAGEYGSDMVCCALSTLLCTLENMLMDHNEALHPSISRSNGEARYTCHPTKGNKQLARIIYQTIFIGFEMLAHSYPDNVQAIKTE